MSYFNLAGFFIASYLVLLSNSCFSQQYKFQLLESEFINRNTDCSRIHQDELGMMWFATGHGAYKYDGVNIFPFLHDPNDSTSINHNLIFDIDEDKKNIYLTAWGGKEINCIDKETGNIFKTKITVDKNSTYRSLLCHSNGNKITTGSSGLVYFSLNEKMKQFLPINSFSDIIGIGNNNELLVMSESELITFSISTNKIIERKKTKLKSKITCMENINQAIIYGTKTGLISEDNSIKIPAPLNALNILSLKYDSNKNLWIGTEGEGLFRWNLHNNEIIHFEVNDKTGYLNSNIVKYIYEDRNNLLWFGTDKGIYFTDLKSPKITYYSLPTNTLAQDATPMSIDKNGVIWVGSRNNIFLFDLKLKKFYHSPFEVKNVSRIHFDNSKSNVWIASETEGVYQYKYNIESQKYVFAKQYKSEPFKKNTIHSNTILAIHSTPDSNLWFGSYGKGTALLKSNKNWRYFTNTEFKGVAASDILQENDSTFWFTFYDSGLYKGIKKKNEEYTFISIKSMGHDLCYDVMSSITIDSKGVLWIATFGGGITEYNPKNHTSRCYTNINGLPSNNVYNVECDSDDNVWCSSSNGIAYLKKGTNVFRSFSTFDGLPQNNFNFASSCIINDSSIYFGTKSEICNIETKKLINLRPEVYTPIISSIKLFNKDIEIGKGKPVQKVSHLATELVLDYNQDLFSIDFTNKYYRNPKQVTYSYLLEEFNDDWVNIGKNSTAFFTRLPAGKYKLYYRTSIDDGINYDTCINPLEIRILPPWYQTWWFRLLSIVSIILMVWQLIKFRTKRLLDKQRMVIEKEMAIDAERKRIARDMHDDLGSGLSAIHLYSDYLRNNLAEKFPEISDDINKIVHSSSELNQKVKEIIWSNESKMQSISNVFQFLKKSYTDFINNTSCNLSIPEINEEHDLQLDALTSKNIYLCLKEALNNSIKYSNAKNINVSFEILDGKKCFIVKDDGIGFALDAGMYAGGRGLANIKSRMQDLNGIAKFHSTHDGTIVKLILL